MRRIRSIKPSFFFHEDLSALPAEAHLLAAGLLCYADDDGYFNANPRLVQSSVFPLRELSGSLPELLQNLSAIGFIELGTGADGKHYGRIPKFLDHQKVSHPVTSIIKNLPVIWNTSGNPPELIQKTPDVVRPELNRIELNKEQVPAQIASDCECGLSSDSQLPPSKKPDPALLRFTPDTPSTSRQKRALRFEPLARKCYDAYPRHVAREDALRAFTKAIAFIGNRQKWDDDTAAAWMLGRVESYAKSPYVRATEKDKIPYPASWVNKGQFDDGEGEWGYAAGAVSAAQPKPNTSALDAVRAMQAEAKRQAASSEARQA